MKYFEYIPATAPENPNENFIYYSKVTGIPITGFYNIDDNGDAWQSKYEQIYSVVCDDVIEDALNHSPYYKDRIPTESLILPYSLNDILVDANDIVKASTYNNAIDKLYSNMVYIYSNCFIPNSYIPFKIENWACRYKKISNTGSNNNKFKWQLNIGGANETKISPVEFDYHEISDDIINMRLINNIREAVTIRKERDGVKYDYMFAITTMDTNSPTVNAPFSNRIICLKSYKHPEGESIVMDLILNTIYADDSANQDIDTITDTGGRVEELQYSNNITFDKLNSITYDGERYIYVLDGANNHIYMYDISNIVNEDKLFKRRFMLVNIFGDQDAMGSSNYKFITPTLIRYINNQLVVFDEGDDSIKIFDRYFNWLGTMNNRNFTRYVPKDIIHSEITNEYYLLTEDAYLLKYDKDFRLIDRIFTDVYLQNEESCLKLYKSYNNSNICYLLTNKRVFKKFISKIDKNIGSFLFHRYRVIQPLNNIWNKLDIEWEKDPETWNKYGDSDLSPDYFDINVKCMAIFPWDEKYDEFYVVVNSRILWCKDYISYNTLLANNNHYILDYYSDFTLYKLEDIHIGNEYVQALTYNKSLFKLLYNLNYLAKKIIFRPEMAYDWYTNILLKSLEYIQNDILDSEELKVYDNENVDVCVINRLIERIYDFENKILTNIQTKITNTKNPLNANMDLF